MQEFRKHIKLLSRYYPTDTQHIFREMKKSFSLDELKDLCFELRVDFDDLDGVGKRGKIRELILTMERQKRLAELIERVIAKRPKTPFRPFFADAKINSRLGRGKVRWVTRKQRNPNKDNIK